MWKSARESAKHKLADQAVELKDDRSLCPRVDCCSLTPEINLKEGTGQHEFTSLPLALFTMSGVLPSTDKSKLVAILEELPNKTGGDQQPEETAPLPPRR